MGAYIHQRRMARAALTLKLTTLSVNDVASLFNYSSDSNFTRAFHDFFKKTPTEYRKEEKWDINKLQYPLYIEEMDINSKNVILNTPVFIRGERIHYNAEYKNVSDCSFINKLKGKINKELMEDSGEIWLSSALSTKKAHEAREGYIGVDIIMESTGKTEVSIMKPGVYSTLRFTGDWSEYSVFSRIAYIKYLSRGNKSSAGNAGPPFPSLLRIISGFHFPSFGTRPSGLRFQPPVPSPFPPVRALMPSTGPGCHGFRPVVVPAPSVFAPPRLSLPGLSPSAWQSPAAALRHGAVVVHSGCVSAHHSPP
ncbi:helix-turn-helix transcriptional regulator [Salmonella enterica subsp. enterica serovar Javiana]|nr:helix-turn-helix transcriptional regulator [Salmonella enterica subsp. enterica serovar Javiana]EGO3302118.1 helix-turn-helix transcriptional regulator [Salmonella enterica]EHC5972883.1 helix-turn-helix transcriptional regulator [Salmonella enterica]EIU9581684.1 helix-turn-helix transcriptional regulator [Salmonella enterica]EIV1873189.1 helix-turn-helix transcriptional regulator [Salmonella enterica]